MSKSINMNWQFYFTNLLSIHLERESRSTLGIWAHVHCNKADPNGMEDPAIAKRTLTKHVPLHRGSGQIRLKLGTIETVRGGQRYKCEHSFTDEGDYVREWKTATEATYVVQWDKILRCKEIGADRSIGGIEFKGAVLSHRSHVRVYSKRNVHLRGNAPNAADRREGIWAIEGSQNGNIEFYGAARIQVRESLRDAKAHALHMAGNNLVLYWRYANVQKFDFSVRSGTMQDFWKALADFSDPTIGAEVLAVDPIERTCIVANPPPLNYTPTYSGSPGWRHGCPNSEGPWRGPGYSPKVIMEPSAGGVLEGGFQWK